MLIYTKGRELLEKDLREQENTDADQNQTTLVKPEPKQRSKKFRRFFRKMNR
ncbi:hypothetical protein [Natribacillus halophilus]|uniref:Uncharacterized protein n=1 Tax=Natribacillus halophilus TaxID=549003 RepID=A0A1G8RIV2_9BACI|nr:hypothetical protein [Natribacillus halophilus]SDJ17004.1 hypothetical protein SAMN04488123_11835 [Natribacillus halophilus]